MSTALEPDDELSADDGMRAERASGFGFWWKYRMLTPAERRLKKAEIEQAQGQRRTAKSADGTVLVAAPGVQQPSSLRRRWMLGSTAAVAAVLVVGVVLAVNDKLPGIGFSPSEQDAYDLGYSFARELDDGLTLRGSVVSTCQALLYSARAANQALGIAPSGAVVNPDIGSGEVDAFNRGCRDGAPAWGDSEDSGDEEWSSANDAGEFPPLDPTLTSTSLAGVEIGFTQEEVEDVWGPPTRDYGPTEAVDALPGDITATWDEPSGDPACFAQLTFRSDEVAAISLYPCFEIETDRGGAINTYRTPLASIQATYLEGELLVDPPADEPDALLWVVPSEVEGYSLVFSTTDEVIGADDVTTADPSRFFVFEIALMPASEITCGLMDGSRGSCSRGSGSKPPTVPSSGMESATLGSTEAVLSYSVADPAADRSNGVSVRGVRLKVQNGNKLVFDRPVECPKGGCHLSDYDVRVRVAHLEQGNPHVIVNMWSGGMHCCTDTLIYSTTSRSAPPLVLEWPSFGAGSSAVGSGLRDADGDGYFEFVSGDGRFPTYASQAELRLPLQVWALRHGRLTDVTRAFPGLLRADSKSLWSEYEAARKTTKEAFLGGTVNGCFDSCREFLGAWAAEQALLGSWESASAVLRKAVERGELEGDMSEPATGAAYLTQLEALLRKHKYIRE